MAISYVSSASAAATSLTMPSHQAGDLLVAYAFWDGSTAGPTIPAGWSQIQTAGANTCSHKVAIKWATSSSETSGTWTNATGLVIHVYRGVGATGVTASGTGSSNSITYPALTLQKANSTSWVARFAGHKTATNMTTNTPVGYTARTGVATEARGCDSNGGLSSNPTADAQSVNQTNGWCATSIELLAPSPNAGSTFFDDFNTGSTPDSSKWATTTIGAGKATLSGGALVLTSDGSSLARVDSLDVYNFTGDALFAQLKSSTLTAGGAFLQILNGKTGGTLAYWQFNSSGATPVFPGGTTGAARAHTDGDWYRIRESGGTLYYDYSSNGTSWTNHASASLASRPVSACAVELGVSTGASASFENFNVIPSAPPANTGAFFAFF